MRDEGCGPIKITFQARIGLRKTAIRAYLIEIIDLNLWAAWVFPV
jgi:hypothetical protein